MTDYSIEQRQANFGLIGFILGIVSLLVIFAQLSAFFEPAEQSTGTMIGEMAAEIKQSAARVLAGEPAPAPEPPAQDYSQIITIAALCAAAAAIVVGGIALYRNEPHRLPYMAIGFGVSSYMFLFVFWLAVLICGAAILISMMENLDNILE